MALYSKRALRKFKLQPPYTTSTKNVWHTRKITRLTTDPSIRAHTTVAPGWGKRGIGHEENKGIHKITMNQAKKRVIFFNTVEACSFGACSFIHPSAMVCVCDRLQAGVIRTRSFACSTDPRSTQGWISIWHFVLVWRRNMSELVLLCYLSLLKDLPPRRRVLEPRQLSKCGTLQRRPKPWPRSRSWWRRPWRPVSLSWRRRQPEVRQG